MDNLSGSLEKIIEQKGLSNLPKRIKRWDMLFIDDHGKVISFHHIKVIVISFLILLLILISASISLFFLNKGTKKKVIELQSALELSRQDYRVLQQEMHTLMIRLAEAQSNAPTRPTRKKEKTVKKAPPRTQKPSPPKKQLAKATATSPEKRISAQSNVTKKSEKKPQPKPSLGKKEVGVFDFSAAHNPEQNVLNARFIIKNLNRNIPDISGYIFILLKEDGPDQEKWFSIPTAELVSGKPARLKAGQFFKIRKATVMIFSQTEELLLKKSYRVEIDVPAPPPKVLEKKPDVSAPDSASAEKNESPPADIVNSSPEEMENNTEEENIKEEIPNTNADTDALITPSDPNWDFLKSEG